MDGLALSRQQIGKCGLTKRNHTRRHVMDAMDFLKQNKEELGHLVGMEIYDVDPDADQIQLIVRDFESGVYVERVIYCQREGFEISDPEPVIEPHWTQHR